MHSRTHEAYKKQRLQRCRRPLPECSAGHMKCPPTTSEVPEATSLVGARRQLHPLSPHDFLYDNGQASSNRIPQTRVLVIYSPTVHTRTVFRVPWKYPRRNMPTFPNDWDHKCEPIIQKPDDLWEKTTTLTPYIVTVSTTADVANLAPPKLHLHPPK